MTNILLFLILLLLLCVVGFLVVLVRRRLEVDFAPLLLKVEALEKGHERTERAVRDEIARNREEGSAQARALREEVAGSLKNLSDSTLKSLGEISLVQQQRLESFAVEIVRVREISEASAKMLREELTQNLKGFNDSVLGRMTDVANLQKNQLEMFASQLGKLTQSNEAKLDLLKTTVEAKLGQIQQDNAARLEEMRKTVDEKLQSVLETRLNQSFKLVSERLELVQRGLGEMQSLASGVGDLKKVLTNVKTRGTWGEIQLGNLLEQILTPEQFERNVATKQGSADRVEYAIKLPGGEGQEGGAVWLPIDAKFPKEDYERLVDAADRADAVLVEEASKQLESRIKLEAKNIRDKYIDPPNTTDFGILYLPTEGLYAEALRRQGLAESLQRECRVSIAGPTTLGALLNSLQMGFRTLAIQKRSSEVWTVLAAVKTEFGKFGEVIDKVQRKLHEASDVIDRDVAVRTRVIERRLKNVQELPSGEVVPLLQRSADATPESDEAEDGQTAG